MDPLSGLFTFIGWLAHLLGQVRHGGPDGRDDVTQHATQLAILEFLDENPGAHVASICDHLEAPRSTVSHHLHAMENDGLLTAVLAGRHRCYFAAETHEADPRTLAVLLRGRALDVALAVQDHPGIIQKDLEVRLGTTRKVIRGHMDLLTEKGLLDEVPEARVRRYFPTKLLNAILMRLKGTKPPKNRSKADSEDE